MDFTRKVVEVLRMVDVVRLVVRVIGRVGCKRVRLFGGCTMYRDEIVKSLILIKLLPSTVKMSWQPQL